jgi:hypothetical protein
MGTEESKEPKGEVRQVAHGQDVKVREMRRAETFLNIIEDQGKLYEAKVKETRKLESRMMRQVSSPVRRRAERKGRKNGPRSQPILLQSSRSTFLGEVYPAFLPSKKAGWAHQFRYLGVGQQYPSLS